jgi:hypothetical protein
MEFHTLPLGEEDADTPLQPHEEGEGFPVLFRLLRVVLQGCWLCEG